MLGKKRTYSNPGKWPPRKKLARASSSMSEFGAGYNPKAVSFRRRPPNGEIKYHDNGAPYTTLANVSTTTTPPHSQISSFCLIPQGDLSHQRNGNKIMITKLTFRFGCMIDTNSNATFNSVVQTSST